MCQPRAHLRGFGPLPNPQEITRDDLAGRDRALGAITDDGREALERGTKGENSTLCSQFLREAERGIEEDNQPDRRCFDGLADRGRDERRRDEQPDEWLDELTAAMRP